MKTLLTPAVILAAALVLAPRQAAGQEFEAAGTRAQGLGGAFVGVADDASAMYWNPAGLAGGAYFSLLLDRNSDKSKPAKDMRGASRSGTIIALSTPALGIGYYRLRVTSLTPLPTALAQQDRNFRADGVFRVDTLVTHHAGVTLVQSVTSRIAVGTTFKLVRGISGSSVETDTSRDALLDRATEPAGSSASRFDADIGLMAALGAFRAGLTVRNVREPQFEFGEGRARRLERQARAGISARPLGVLLAADVDLTRTTGRFGDTRNVAAGFEARIVRRATLRAGFHVNTIADAVYGHTRGLAFGGSVAVTATASVDALVSRGADTGSAGWGVAGRVLF